MDPVSFEDHNRRDLINEKEYILRTLFDVAQVGFVLIDQSHKVIDANPCFANMLGYPMDEVMQLHTWDWEAIMPSEQIKEDFADLSSVYRKFETIHRRKDGTTFPVEVNAAGTKINGENVILCVCIDISLRKKAEQEILYMSTHDPLTGLYNRAAYDVYVKELEANPVFPITIFSCDMNGLKEINDTYGHVVGDDVIKRCARMMSSAVGEEGFAARLGGDEFVIVSQGMNRTGARKMRRKILEMISAANQWQKPPVFLAVGFAVCAGEPFVSEQFFRLADKDMYRMKQLSKVISKDKIC